MDIAKLSNDKKLELCKWYYTVGCFLLPFVWLVNAVWFFHDAFLKPAFEEQKAIRKYVILSSVGALIFAIAFISWMVTFQLQREAWGPAGDAISFIVPRGRA